MQGVLVAPVEVWVLPVEQLLRFEQKKAAQTPQRDACRLSGWWETHHHTAVDLKLQ